MALSADGGRVAFDDYEVTGHGDGATVQARLRICDAGAGHELLAVPAGNLGISCLAFSPDRQLLAAGMVDRLDGRMGVWETATGRRLCEAPLEFIPFALSFNPDGRRLAVVGRDRVAVMDGWNGKSILTLRGAPPRSTDGGSNATLAWSPDGRRLAASNWDGSVAVWDGTDLKAKTDSGPLERVPQPRVYGWHLDQAEAALRAGQPLAAAFHLKRVRGSEPPDLASRRRRGRLLVRHGEWSARPPISPSSSPPASPTMPGSGSIRRACCCCGETMPATAA